MSDTLYLDDLRREELHEAMATADAVWADSADWESQMFALAAEGDVEALEAVREQLTPIDYEELGWGG